MADYLGDLREITRNGEGSELKKSMLLRSIDKLERKFKARGIEVTDQAELVRSMVDGRKDAETEFRKTMYRFCAARLLRSNYSDWTGWQYRDDFAIAMQLHPQRWRGEKIESLAVLGEQGVGDEIMFASCVPDLQRFGIEVTIECDPRLETIFQRSFKCKTRPRDDIVNRGASKYVSTIRPEEAVIPSGDLAKMFRRKREDFRGPFLTPDPEKVEKWGRLQGRYGIAWRGRRGKFTPAELGGEGRVCLQYDAWEVETERLIVPECDLREDLEDLMGICANLGKVITVPQTIVHLAGAQGIGVEVIIPPVKSAARAETQDQLNWRYGKGGRMDWYPSVTVYPGLNAYRHR